MARVILLGTAAAVSDAEHDNTHFLLVGDSGTPILVDCGSNPLGKMHKLGIPDDTLQDVILTHFHPDHVSGFPNMLMQLWLLGRQKPLRLYGLNHCINRVEDMMIMFAWDTWPDFFPVPPHRVLERSGAPVLENDDFRIIAYPTRHFIPTIGLRIENKHNGRILAYSCDTEPIPAIVDIARNADILIHEAAGEGFGHSSARQAGEIATQAGAKSLYLIHYQVWNTDPTPLVAEAAQTYAGPVALCQDYDEYEF
ncbi:MAG: MBL fold metallo-hydrolase [Phototrophicales bacterium]|nr:MAG: MBL fold metallo-hydrolase [Phototrophicales bacterium]